MAVSLLRPRCGVIVRHAEHRRANPGRQRDRLPLVGQFALENSVHNQAGITALQRRPVYAEQKKFPACEQAPLGENKTDTAAEKQATQVQRRFANVFQLEKLELAGANPRLAKRVVHDLVERQARAEAGQVRFAGDELHRRRPVTPRHRAIAHPHAGTVSAALADDALRDSHGPDKLISLQFPNRVELVLPRLTKLEKRRLWIGHLRQPPLDAGELFVVSRPARLERTGLEAQLVQRKTARPVVSDRRRVGDVGELGFVLEVVVAVTARVAVANAPSSGIGVSHEIEHVLHHALVILALEPARPCAATVALALGRHVKLAAMASRRSRMVVPHELIDIDKCQRLARWVDKACMLIDELADLAAGRRGVIKQQIKQFTGAILELDIQRLVTAKAAFDVDRALPVCLWDDQHVQIPWHRIPMVVRVMVEHLVPAFADVHVADDPVHAAKRVVGRQVEIIAPPLERL